MQSISGVGVARVQRACDSHCSLNQNRCEIAASPHPAVLRTSTLPVKGRVVRVPHFAIACQITSRSAGHFSR